jgi:hypothetical protein
MNDLLIIEAAERFVERSEEGERLAKLEATTSANRRAVRTRRHWGTGRQQLVLPPPGPHSPLKVRERVSVKSGRGSLIPTYY